MGEQYVDRGKYQDLKKLQMQTEQNMLKFQNEYLMEKAEVEALKMALKNAKKEFDQREKQLSDDYVKLMDKYHKLQTKKQDRMFHTN